LNKKNQLKIDEKLRIGYSYVNTLLNADHKSNHITLHNGTHVASQTNV